MEFSLLGAAAIAAVCAWAILRVEARRTASPEHHRRVWDALVVAAVGGLLAGRLVAMIAGGTNPLANPADILIVRGGVDTIAAVGVGIGSYLIAVRRDLGALADGAAAAALAGLAGWHAGCVVRDACLGTRSDLPWAISGSGSVTRHPVELYTVALLVLAVTLVLAWQRRRPPPGVVSAAAVTMAAAARWITEPLRLGLGGPIGWWYLSGMAAAVGVAVFIGWRHQTSPEIA